MPDIPSAVDLLRSVGLDVDGPARWGTNPSSRAPGVFVIEAPTPTASPDLDPVAIRRWLERVPDLAVDGERPTEAALGARLASFWVPGQTLLYVGRTAKALSGRVASLYATELGHRRPHPGGHWLKTLRTPTKLRLWWAETEAPEEYEDAVMSAFADAVPADARRGLPRSGPLLPWANLESPTAGRRESGISHELLSVEATPAKRSDVKRSDATGRVRRAGAVTATRSPGKSARGAKSGSTAAPAKRDQPTHLTAAGLVAMEAELERLRNVERPAVIDRVKHARELGDLRENADYEAARNEQSFLEGRILQLEQQVRTAVIIESGTGHVIAMGSTVRYEIDGTADELTIVGSSESDPGAGRISAVSPVGKALLGRRPGDDVIVKTPAAEIHYRILEIT